MEHSQLAIVGLNCFFNQPFNSQIFSAFIYNGKTIKDADINHLDYPLQSPPDSFSVLSKVAHQALEDCKINSHKKVAVITNNPGDVLAKHLSNLGNFSAISFSLDAEKDCLLKALEISQILLTAKEVDTVIISVVNSDLNTNNLNAGAIIIKDYRVAQQDGDRIYAVLQSFTRIADNFYPSSTAIQQSCQQALQQAKIHPSDIGYIEVSNEDIEGENSPEFLGLINAYAAAKHDLTCAVGSVKANLGDLGIAAGVISLIKTALCIYNRYLPPYPQWQQPQYPEIWQNSPFYVPTVSHPWFLSTGQEKRQAAVNLVTEDGTYGHIILSEVTTQTSRNHGYLPYASVYLFPIAANEASSLQTQLDDLAARIETSLSLPHTARENFSQFQSHSQSRYVVAIVGESKETLQREIKQAKKGIEKALSQDKPWKSPKGSYFTPKPLGKQGKIAFVYPGAFNSYLGMGRNLLQLFPKLWNRITSLIKDPGEFLQAKHLYPKSQHSLSQRDLEALETEFIANPLSLLETGTGFAVMFTDIMQQYFQIKPQVAFGYSMGESTMMYSLGVWSNADEGSQFIHDSPLFHTRLIGTKQTVSEYWGEPAGENLWSSHVLMASPAAVKECLQQEPRVYLTHINAPQEVVIAGDPQGCLRVIERLQCDAFRSPSDMVLHCQPMESEFAAFKQLNTVNMGTPPDTVFYSSANYQPIPLEQSAIAQHLTQGVCQPLEFPRLINRAYQDGVRIFLELGSGGSCSRWISETLNTEDHLAVCINRRGVDDLTGIVKMLAQLVSHQVDLDLSPLYLSQQTATQVVTLSQNSTLVASLPTAKTDISPCLFNEDDILEFIEGKVSQVFGEKYQEIDSYTRRVRMPSPPFLFVSRVTQLEGKLGDYKSGFIETEYDIPEDAWYAIDGQLTVGICKEAGHGLLMLLSYLGTDFENQGKRSFRLLDLSATFLFEQPEAIKTLKCRVKITSSVKTEKSLLVFFQGEALIGDQVWMKLHDGCAGLFSDEELEQGQGIVISESEEKQRQQIQKQQFTPLLTCSKSSFTVDDILPLTVGNLGKCFGEKYHQNSLNPSLRLPPEKLLMLDNVIMVNPQGGLAGLGLAIGSKEVTPEDWYFFCHFRNDPTMPGNLMIEGSIQLVQFYCLFLGLQTRTKDARFQIIPGKTQAARFRGQVTPQTGTLMYQMEVLELGLSPQPYAVANVDVIFGGRTIATIKNIGVQLVEKPLAIFGHGQWGMGHGEEITNAPCPMPKATGRLSLSTHKGMEFPVAFNEEQLKQFARGSVSACLGSEFDIYENRQSVRLPNGDFQLVSRVLEIEGKRHELPKPSQIITEYDVKPNAWFYEHNAYPTLPYCTYIEIAGQPCIFLGVYMGATLLSPDEDLHFRNLDGQGTILKEIDLRNKTITDKVRLLSTTAIKGAIIQKFEFELSCEGEPFYRGNMVFGDFSTAVLANQVGLDGGKRLKPWYQEQKIAALNLTTISLKDPNWRQKLYQINPSRPHYRLSEKYLDFLDELVIVEGGGNYQKGYLYAQKVITPEDWYFPCHFYQDPVMPGALGVESIIQAMQAYALQLDLGKSLKNPRFGQAINHQITWKYRGQITPENRLMSLEVHISEIKYEPERITIIGDASLWKEDLRIYEIKDIALCLSEA
ncbi:PfaB family protein [Calothrix sp. FACHB-1219]|uniref:PfaB family protein n=1 Tax=unclassified Calothrix TaxID=2619626 RepID=UPI0016885ED3|nr:MULTISPECIES: PfaB family protein [unclassified Calothrix]MBD2203727.1 PfaB family protein [Calothrix sp. FACHB-168]MBD2219547.1 PfaB family protein [Calothrix sp. FACHB-1219]